MAEGRSTRKLNDPRKPSLITIEHINAQSLLSHKNEIEMLITSRNIDILCISETWLLPNLDDSFLHVQNFIIFRRDQGRGGGVCIYVRSDLHTREITTNNPANIEVEDVWIVVQHHKLPSFIVGAIYRHPHALNVSFDYLLDIFRYISLRNKPLFILGDLNEDLLVVNRLDRIIKNNGLTQMIKKPTRITSSSATLLDVVVTNRPNMIVNSDVYPCEIADHDLISVQINIAKPKRQPIYKTLRSMCVYNRDAFCNLILSETGSLNFMLLTDDVDYQINLFTETFNNCLNTCAPAVTKDITRPPAPWLTSDIKKSIQSRNETQMKLKENRSDEIFTESIKNRKVWCKNYFE